MKKIVATALSLLVGAFGYTIVDKSIDQRVTDLEMTVSFYSDEISVLNSKIDSINSNFAPKTAHIDCILSELYDDAEVKYTFDPDSGEWFFMDSPYNGGELFKIPVCLENNSEKELYVYINDTLYYYCKVENINANLYISNQEYYFNTFATTATAS